MELTSNALQTVTIGSDVLFTETAVRGCPAILHREGSGLVTLRGLTNQCRARFKVSFGANIALPEGTTPIAPVSLALALNGEPIPTSSMISTPAADAEFNNVYASIFVDVVSGCCVSLSVRNIGTTPVDVQNANIIIERVA